MNEEDSQEIILYPLRSGGWGFDYCKYGWYEGATPDAWAQTKEKSDLEEYIIRKYPGAKVSRGVTGQCVECGEEHFNHEDTCINCGEEVYP